MDNNVKIERLSPLLLELKYEMEATTDTSTEAQQRIESPQQFQQQVLRPPFMSEKSSPPQSIISIYNMEAECSNSQSHLTTVSSNSDVPEHSHHQIPPSTASPPTIIGSLYSDCEGQSVDDCYSYMTVKDHARSSPQRTHSSLLVSSAVSHNATQCSSSMACPSIPCSSSLPCPSSIPCSSSLPCPSSIPCSSSLPCNIPCSSSMACSASVLTTSRSRHCSSPSCGSPLSSDLLSRDVRPLVGNGVTMSRRRSDATDVPADSVRSIEQREEQGTGPYRGGSKGGAGISDAVTKILDDVDWSIIPMANKWCGRVAPAFVVCSGRQKVHVKRPMNAFMVWAQEARRKLSGQHRQVHNAELSKSLGKIWRGMSDDQKRPFIERADQLRQKHKQEYPNYKYQPRRRKENVKTVTEKSNPTPPSGGQPLVSLHGGQGMTGPQQQLQQQQQQPSAFVSSLKGGLMAVPPLSPPHSPTLRPEDASPALTETVFVSDCLTADSLEGIDRAEMNRYLWPDQGMAMGMYPQQQHPGTSSSPSGSSPHTLSSSTSSPLHTLSGSPHTLTSAPSPLAYPAPLQHIPSSRVLGPPPLYSGPTYCSVPSGVLLNGGSPDAGEATSSGSSSSPPPPVDLVELQPARRDEPLPSLTAHKGVNPFLANNICYSQPYPYNYSYSYAAMWH